MGNGLSRRRRLLRKKKGQRWENLSLAQRSAAEDLRVLLSVSRALNWVKVAIWKIESGVRRRLPVAGSEAAAAWEVGQPASLSRRGGCCCCLRNRFCTQNTCCVNECCVRCSVPWESEREMVVLTPMCTSTRNKDTGNCVSSFCGSRLQATNWFAHEIWGHTINTKSFLLYMILLKS
jgi:hypothetical protein